MIRNFLDGFTSYFRHLGLISKFGLWIYVLIPSVLSVLLGGLIFSTAWNMADSAGAVLLEYYPFEWGKSTIEKVLNVIGGLGIFGLGIILFKYVILIIASPFMSFLSERIENKISGNKTKASFSISNTVKGVFRGLRLTLRNISRELGLTLFLVLLGLIPIFSLPSFVLILLVQAYYAGFGNMDFTLERRFNVGQSARFIRKNRGFALGNGLAFVLLLLTGFGFLIALPLGVIGATVGTLNRLDEQL